MVDLVKIRQKAKEKKQETAEKAAEVTPPEQAAASQPAPPPKEAAPSPAPKKEKKRSEPASAVEKSEDRNPSPERRPPAPVVLDKLERFKQTAGRREEVRREESSVAVTEAVEELELLTFMVAGEQYAIEIEKIVEIIAPRPTTRVPNAAANIVGIISLRGTIVTILDFRGMLGHPPSEGEGPDTRMIVVEHAGEIAGFVVDKVWRKISIDPSEVESHPIVSANEQSEYIRGVFQQGSALSIVLDLERLLRR